MLRGDPQTRKLFVRRETVEALLSATDRCEALEAEVARLREALGQASEQFDLNAELCGCGRWLSLTNAGHAARRALESRDD